MTKEKYEKPVTNVIAFLNTDVLTSSATSMPSVSASDPSDNDVVWDDWSPWY